MVAISATKDTAPTTHTNGTERILAEVLAGVVHAERVPVDSHFFDDLGANSLVMAHFCARVRKRDDLPSVSIKDVYGHPTIRSLAAALTDAPAEPRVRAPAEPAGAGQHLAVRPVRSSAVPGLRRVLPAQRTGHRPGLRMDLGRFGRRGRLPPVGRLRRRHAPRGLRAPGGGQVGARGPLEARRVPRLGPGLPALLDRQGAADTPTRCACSPATRCTCCICGPSAPGSARASRSSPQSFRSAPTC